MLAPVLVIDGDLGIVNAFKATLPRWGFAVAGFVSMAQGLEALKNEKPQALVLDIQLPKSQSLTLLREIKKLYPSLPIVTITAYSTNFTEAEAIRAGADAHFAKPINPDAFARKLKALAGNSEAFATMNKLALNEFRVSDIVSFNNARNKS